MHTKNVLPQHHVVRLVTPRWSKQELGVAHSLRLHELYPDFYTSFIELSLMFDWQEALLAEWATSCCPRIRKEGGNWIADSLSQAEEMWLAVHGIKFQAISYGLDVD